MAQVAKIDSNSTGLAYAGESTLATLSSPVWIALEPNGYSDFGSEITNVSPTPITNTRSRKKGVTTDLDAMAQFNHNLSLWNLEDILQGFMFASWERKGREVVTAVDLDTSNPDEYEVASTTGFVVGSVIRGFKFTNAANNALNVVTAITASTSVEVATGQLVTEASPPAGAYIQVVGHQGASGDIDVAAGGDLATLTSTSLDFTTLGLVAGQWIFIGGDTAATRFATAANNGFKRIRSIAANILTLDKSTLAMVTEASTSETIQIFYGDVLRNRVGTSILRRTYHLERLLGAPDDSAPGDIQTQIIKGAVGNEFTLNVPTANLVNVDLGFIGTDEELRDSTAGPLQSSVTTPILSDVFNTSSDFSRIKIAVVSSVNEAPVSLAAFITEATININNNVSPNKAVGTLGAFDLTAGIFQVGGSITAYFNNVSAITSVRNNSNVTMDMAMVKDNGGLVIDIPLISLGDGRLNVSSNEPITIPLNMEAADASAIFSGFTHTLMWTWFGYLPTAAE